MDHLSELKQKPIWTNYVRVWNEKKQGYNKPPVNPKNLYNASPTNPEHWTDYATAFGNIGKTARIYQNGALVAEQPIEGVGIVLARPLTGIDIDHAIDPKTGEIMPFAKKIVEELDSYTELSPSGTGLHIFVLDDEAEDLSGEFRGINADGSISEEGTAEIDAYNNNRYFTLTGKLYRDRPIRKTSGALRRILAEYGEKKRQASGTTAPQRQPSPVVSGVTEESVKRMVESALEAIRPADLEFNGWIAVGSALKLLGYGCDVWETWSKDSGANPRHVDGYTYKRWAKLRPIDEPAQLIIGKAKQYGWKAADVFSNAERWSYGRNQHTKEELAEYARQKASEEAKDKETDEQFMEELNRVIEADKAPQRPQEEPKKDAPIVPKVPNVNARELSKPQPKNGKKLISALTYDMAVNTLLNANDEGIIIPNFESFSKQANIGQHDSVVIAGVTGSGKSMLAINLMENLNKDHAVMYFNLEMTPEMVLRRMVAIHTGLELKQVEGYKKDLVTQEEVNKALREIANREPIYVENERYTPEEIEDAIKQAVAVQESKGKEEPVIVFIDHALLLQNTGKTLSDYERFSRISENLRKIAKLNNCIMFVLTQQNRQGSADKDKEPELSSLKSSGSFENDATHVCFIWRSGVDGNYYLVLKKNRKGKSETKWELEITWESQFVKAPRDGLELGAITGSMGNVTLPEAKFKKPTNKGRRKKKKENSDTSTFVSYTGTTPFDV